MYFSSALVDYNWLKSLIKSRHYYNGTASRTCSCVHMARDLNIAQTTDIVETTKRYHPKTDRKIGITISK